MKLSDCLWFVVSSVLFGSMTIASLVIGATAETRPQYGSAVHVAMRGAPVSLDPVDLDSAYRDAAKNAPSDAFALYGLSALTFDTLVTIDQGGRIQPWLATSWQALPGSQRWQFQIRRGVKFHDGSALSAEAVVASLRAANPSWNVRADGDSVVIDCGKSNLELPSELSLARNAIVKRNAGSTPTGTGPFHVTDWQPGKSLSLAAEENCWRGRPFLDSVQIEMGRSFRDQMTALELGKTDLVEVAPEQAHRISQQGRRLASSAPIELMALVFSREAASPDEKLLREALALSVERASMRSVLLQGAGQAAASLLPDWMSGYGFVFPTDADLARARKAREQVHSVTAWKLGYDGTDPTARLLAERIALNAKDAGLSLQPTSSATADLRLVRIPLSSPDPWIALAKVAAVLRTREGKDAGSVEDLYASELAVLATQRVIPLFHLPVSYAASGSLNNWKLRPDGTWNLADAWVGNDKP